MNEARFFGGAQYRSTGSNIYLDWSSARMHIIQPSAAIDVTLPAAWDVASVPGGPVFCVVNNQGTHAITVKDAGGNTVATVAAWDVAKLSLSDNGSANGVWHAMQMDHTA